jgi:hypothetical protein
LTFEELFNEKIYQSCRFAHFSALSGDAFRLVGDGGADGSGG